MPRIWGKNIVLREYSMEDLSSIRKWVNNPDVVDTLSDYFLFPQSEEQTASWLRKRLDGPSDHNSAQFIIADVNSDKYLGQIDIQTIDWKNRSARIAIVLGTESRNRGYGTDAIKTLVSYCFEEMNLNRIDLTVKDYNKNAIRCYEKCGFIVEGRMRETFYFRGKYRDHFVMAILKNEWID